MNEEDAIYESFRTSIEILERQYEEGHQESLFVAIALCARFDYKMPEWVRNGFLSGWGRYRAAVPGPTDKPGQSTLGGAFGIVRSANFKPSATRRRVYASLIWQFVQNEKRRDPSKPIDERLFERAAKQLPKDGGAEWYKIVHDVDLPPKERKRISGKTAERMYYEFLAKIDPDKTS